MMTNQGHPEMATPTRRIADWVASVPTERTAEFQGLAMDGVQDLIGCMIAGSVEPTAQKVAAVAARWGAGPTSIVGREQRVTSTAAAFANGAAAHILDFDDSFAPMTGHPSAVLLPAIFAIAEERGCTGAAALDAYVVGLEVVAAVGKVMNPAHYKSGWHSTATLGAIGAAAAVSRLLGLEVDGILGALSNAVSFCSGSRLQLGYAMKSVHAGMAARDGLVAATLAEQGIHGSPEVIVGPRGLVTLYAGEEGAGDRLSMPKFDEPFAVSHPGITFKPYPTCGSTHRSLDGLLKLREQFAIRSDQIASIDLIIPALNVRNLVYERPTSGLEAKFSMQYCAAVALLSGAVTLSDFSEGAVVRSDVQELMPRINMRTLPDSENTDKDYLDLPAITVIELKTGERYEDTSYARQGSIDFPMTHAARRAKFLGCATRLFSEAKAESLLSQIADLPSVTDFSSLMRAVRSDSAE